MVIALDASEADKAIGILTAIGFLTGPLGVASLLDKAQSHNRCRTQQPHHGKRARGGRDGIHDNANHSNGTSSTPG